MTIDRRRRRDPLLAARAATHGNFDEVAALAQAMKELMRGAPNWPRLCAAQREALEMKATKLARLLCGDPNEPDHWRDDAGYSALVLERLPAAQTPEP